MKVKKNSLFANAIFHLSDLLSAFVLIAAIVTLFSRFHYAADLLANLRGQQSIAGFAILVLCLSCRRWTWATVVCLCLINHAWWFASPVAAVQEDRALQDDLRITFANVFTSNDRYEEIVADLLHDEPDVIVVLELSSILSDRLITETSKTHPYSTMVSEDRGNFGIGMVSRFPLDEVDRFTLNTDIKSIAATVRLPIGRSVRMYATHPLPPTGAGNYQLRNEQLTLLAARIQAFQRSEMGLPIVLVGDFNLTPWSPHFNDFQSSSGLRRLGTRFDLTPTWHRCPVFPFGLAIDHAMISSDLVCTEHRIGLLTGSDHRRVSVRLHPSP